jgi:hypothetical protein
MLCFTLPSCKKSTPSLTSLFWKPPATLDALVKLGAEKRTAPGKFRQEFYSFKKQDTNLQFFYNEEKIILMVLSFKTKTAADSKRKMESIIREHHLTATPSRKFDIEFYTDSLYYSQFIVQDSSLSIRRYYLEHE